MCLRFISSAVGVLLAFLWLIGVDGQGQHVKVPDGQHQQSKWLPGERSNLPNLGEVFVDPVPNAPFSATVNIVWEEELPDGSINSPRSSSKIARDSQGRT